MQIETKLIVVKTKFSSFWGFRDKTCHEQDSGVDELSLVLLHSLKCQRPSQYKFFCQYLIETSMDLWTCCPTRLSVQDFQRKALQVQSPPWQSVWACPVCFGASLRCFWIIEQYLTPPACKYFELFRRQDYCLFGSLAILLSCKYLRSTCYFLLSFNYLVQNLQNLPKLLSLLLLLSSSLFLVLYLFLFLFTLAALAFICFVYLLVSMKVDKVDELLVS